MKQQGEIILYQDEDGATQVQVRMEEDSIWLSQQQLADLFQTSKQNISLHIKNIFEEGELPEGSTVKEYLTVQQEGKRKVKRRLTHYNLDVIISVGYRVKSHVATRFRIWATQRLKEYIIKGFVLDDERLKEARSEYFDELLNRIRDIRSSEKVFYRKICDIYATSADYDSAQPDTQDFFATVQNKFHWAITGQTAAELIHSRADADQPQMGLTNLSGEAVRKQDIIVAKNYLTEPELNRLNLIVSQYLEYAELQALNRKVMYMAEWREKLNGFLVFNEQEVLDHHGHVSAEQAKQHALTEYEKFQSKNAPLPDEWDKALKGLTQSKQEE